MEAIETDNKISWGTKYGCNGRPAGRPCFGEIRGNDSKYEVLIDRADFARSKQGAGQQRRATTDV